MADSSPKVVHIQMCGEFDIANKDSLAALLLPGEDADAVVIDMSDTTYMDSTALHCFIHLKTQLMARGGGSVRLVGVQPKFRRLFAITGLEKLFDFEDLNEGSAQATPSPPRMEST